MNHNLYKIKASTYAQRRLINLYSSCEILANGCWNWTKCKDKDGYGITSYGIPRKAWRAHRLIYFLLKGEIPEGMLCCHSCDNSSCININHIFIGSPKENSKDRENKGRGGKKNHPTRLTEQDVLLMRKMHSEGIRNCELVKIFNLPQPTISKILKRDRWRHI